MEALDTLKQRLRNRMQHECEGLVFHRGTSSDYASGAIRMKELALKAVFEEIEWWKRKEKKNESYGTR